MKTSISFSGIDGAGKSTQIKNLINLLGFGNCKFYRLKFGYTPGVELLKNLFIFFRRDTSSPIDLVKNKDFSRDPARSQSGLLFYLSICDYVIFVYLIYLKNFFYKKILIFDRYHLDNKFDIAQKFGNSEKLKLFTRLLNYIPSAEFEIILLITPDTSLSRSEAKKDKYAEDKTTLIKKYDFYLNSNCSVIDASGSENEVFKKIIDKMSALDNTPFKNGIVIMNYLQTVMPYKNFDIIDDLENLCRIPFYNHRFNWRIQFKDFTKLFPELWFHESYKKLIILRAFSYIVFYSFYFINKIIYKRKSITTIIECVKFGRTANIFFTSDKKVISIKKSYIRDFKREKKLRGFLTHIPQAEIFSIGDSYMVEAMYFGIPVNRLRYKDVARPKIDVVINKITQSRIIYETDFIETLEASMQNLLHDKENLEIEKILLLLISNVKRIKSKRINKKMNIGICHNDLHDGNILLTHCNQLIFIDFEDIGEAMDQYDKYVQKYKLRTTNGVSNFLSIYSTDNEDVFFQILWSELNFRLNEIKKSYQNDNDVAINTLRNIEYFLADK